MPRRAPPGAAGREAPAACRAFVVSVHHYHVYLQPTWPCLIGFAAFPAARLWLAAGKAAAGAPPTARVAALAGVAALVFLAGAAALLHRRGDALWRETALLRADRHLIDLAACR